MKKKASVETIDGGGFLSFFFSWGIVQRHVNKDMTVEQKQEQDEKESFS